METNHSKEDRVHLQPLLASLARLVATGFPVRRAELETLLVAADIDSFDDALAELGRWETLLVRLRQDSLPQQGQATVEALKLRGLEESAAILAVNMVLDAAQLSADRGDTRGQLVVNPEYLRWDSLSPGQAAVAEIEIRGGPGRIEVESDQIQVIPKQFAEGVTQVSVEIQPLAGGTVWTSLRISTERGFFDVPLLAQWSQSPPEGATKEVRLALSMEKDKWAVENAISDCMAGGVVHLLPGTYQLERGLHIEKGLVLIGSGRDETFLIGSAPDFVLSYGGPTDAVFSLRDLTIRYEGSSGADVILCQQGQIHIKKCRIEGATEGARCGGGGVRLRGTVVGDIEECILSSNQVAGIIAAENARLMASNCVFRENGHGIFVTDAVSSQLINNTCEHSRYCGIFFSGQSSGQVHRNECTANGEDGIRVRDQSAPSLKQNACRKNGRDGIAYYDSARGNACDNICSENQANGISVRVGARPILEKNDCVKNLRLQINNRRK